MKLEDDKEYNELHLVKQGRLNVPPVKLQMLNRRNGGAMVLSRYEDDLEKSHEIIQTNRERPYIQSNSNFPLPKAMRLRNKLSHDRT